MNRIATALAAVLVVALLAGAAFVAYSWHNRKPNYCQKYQQLLPPGVSDYQALHIYLTQLHQLIPEGAVSGSLLDRCLKS